MNPQRAEGFWDFSLRSYRQAGVAELCLALQDQHGLDVNLLLVCCWAGANGVRLSPDQVNDLVSAGEPWQRQVVIPLRAVRRALKRCPSASAIALRQAVKANELEAERLQQATMEACLSLPKGAPDRQAALANLRHYVEHHSSAPSELLIKRLMTLVDAAF